MKILNYIKPTATPVSFTFEGIIAGSTGGINIISDTEGDLQLSNRGDWDGGDFDDEDE